jgi:membrane AbrB-like protein
MNASFRGRGFTAITLLVGATGGLLAHWAQVPAGPLLGAVFAVGSLNLITDGRTHLPNWLAVGGRVMIGTVIGSLATASLIGEVGRNIGWAALFAGTLIVVGLACGAVTARVTDLDLRTAMIATCPGGMPEMAALAEEVGAQVDVVLGIHLLRKLLALLMIAVAIVLS